MVSLDRLGLISEKTVLPIGQVIFLIYICVQAAHLSDRVEATAKAQEATSKDQGTFTKAAVHIDRRLFRLEEKLHIPHPKEDDPD